MDWISVYWFNYCLFMIVKNGISTERSWSNNMSVGQYYPSITIHHKPSGFTYKGSFRIKVGNLAESNRNHCFHNFGYSFSPLVGPIDCFKDFRTI
ncbi:hypothetical protein CLIB1444_03S00452 [[Candida] jaroonii]|uniref:Uncharacterized protein n=1 Tax=[Candida] jaroonii TaxID=467808 RepID=A0ACA9Y4L7_9ASCO|nr:hypothetical protein CLIB1444_03S00452 [[Candida] jaroonii]